MKFPIIQVASLGISVTHAVLISPPTGQYAVSYSVTALTDHERLDPYAPVGNPHGRRVLTSTFIPVNATQTACANRQRVPYMTPLVAEAYDHLGVAVGLPNGTFSALELDFCVPHKSPCRAAAASYPLIVFSPGWGNPRLLYGAIAREIASHGFAVVTIDHPYDATFVEFPDGDVMPAVDIDTDDMGAIADLTKVRAQDSSFLLTHMLANPIPGVNMTAPIIMGHSLGGATAAAAMLSDCRFAAGINIDGLLPEPVQTAGLDSPFVLVGRPGHAADDATWDVFYAVLRDRRAELAVDGTMHASFTDFPTLINSLKLTLPSDAQELLESELGTLEFGRAGEIIAGIVKDFVASVLFQKKSDGIFDGGNEGFPEVSVRRSDFDI